MVKYSERNMTYRNSHLLIGRGVYFQGEGFLKYITASIFKHRNFCSKSLQEDEFQLNCVHFS